MQVRIVITGIALMAVSAFTREKAAQGDCLPCGPSLVPSQHTALSQNSDGHDSVYVVGVYEPARDPSRDLAAAVERATAEQKRILIQVGGDWCVWCHILDDFLRSEKEILSILSDSYLIVKVNFDNVNRNEAFLSKYPNIEGYPHIFVLEHDGSLLHSQHTDELETGRSYSRSALMGFLRKWAPAG